MDFIFLTCAAMTLILQSRADCPPTRLKHEWLDSFTVNVSWDKPAGLQGEVQYKYCPVKDCKDKGVTATTIRSFTATCLTEEWDSDGWTYRVWTDGSQVCNSSNESKRVDITFRNRKPKAKVVEDFRCVIHGNETDCTWTPVDPLLNLMLSYRICGKDLRSLHQCSQFYSRGARTGCRLKVDARKEICILVETEAGMSTFRPKLEIPSPELSVTEEENQLRLVWKRPDTGKKCLWNYELCHTQCSRSRECNNLTFDEEPSIKMPYDEMCRYEFQSRVRTEKYCPYISSDFCEVVTYGTNKPPDRTQTVIAVVITIILCICVLLSCYCLRRHSAILCPTIPDPSVIFKEMMMNGNKDLKPSPGNLYTPVPEPVESCRITPVNENNILQQSV